MEVVALTCNFSTEAEARRLPLVRGQPGLKRVSLSREKKGVREQNAEPGL